MSDLFMILACLVLLTLTLAIAVNLNGSEPTDTQEGFSPVTAQIAYEESEEDGTGPTLTASFDQKTNNFMRSPRTSQIMQVNPQLET